MVSHHKVKMVCEREDLEFKACPATARLLCPCPRQNTPPVMLSVACMRSVDLVRTSSWSNSFMGVHWPHHGQHMQCCGCIAALDALHIIQSHHAPAACNTCSTTCKYTQCMGLLCTGQAVVIVLHLSMCYMCVTSDALYMLRTHCCS